MSKFGLGFLVLSFAINGVALGASSDSITYEGIVLTRDNKDEKCRITVLNYEIDLNLKKDLETNERLPKISKSMANISLIWDKKPEMKAALILDKKLSGSEYLFYSGTVGDTGKVTLISEASGAPTSYIYTKDISIPKPDNIFCSELKPVK